MNIPINNISGEVRLGRSFSAQATVGLRKHEDSRPGYSFKSRHLGLQFRSYILLRQNKFLNGLYVAASTMHSLFSSPDGNDNPIKSRTTNVGIGAGYLQTFLKDHHHRRRHDPEPPPRKRHPIPHQAVRRVRLPAAGALILVDS
ncbi:MAG: hypothetical protein U0176_15160 [Bacteroidia bacterium]